MQDNATITNEELRAVYVATELGGDARRADRFSYAARGNSAYSFGVLQFDVGSDSVARSFLRENGFNASDIEDLRRHGGLSTERLEVLNSKLHAIPSEKMGSFTNARLSEKIELVATVVGRVRALNPIAADAIGRDKMLQLGIADYINQFGPHPGGQFIGYLSGNAETLHASGVTVRAGNPPTREDIQSFINATGYGHNPTNAHAVASREARFNHAMVELGLSAAAVKAHDAHATGVQKLQTELAELGYTDSHGHALKPDGHWGAHTRHAVESFQRDHGLVADGKVGSQTERALGAALQAAQHAATRVNATSAPLAVASGLGPDDPRNDHNPNHALYAELQRRIPDASESRLLQFTAACHSRGIDDKNLQQIHFDRQGGNMAFVGDWPSFLPAVVDLKQPSPSPEQSICQIQQYDQQQAQLNQQIRQDVAQQQGMQGPLPGMTMR